MPSGSRPKPLVWCPLPPIIQIQTHFSNLVFHCPPAESFESTCLQTQWPQHVSASVQLTLPKELLSLSLSLQPPSFNLPVFFWSSSDSPSPGVFSDIPRGLLRALSATPPPHPCNASFVSHCLRAALHLFTCKSTSCCVNPTGASEQSTRTTNRAVAAGGLGAAGILWLHVSFTLANSPLGKEFRASGHRSDQADHERPQAVARGLLSLSPMLVPQRTSKPGTHFRNRLSGGPASAPQ